MLTLTAPAVETETSTPVVATLIHKKSRPILRADLASVPTPAPRGSRHKPVPHNVLVDTLDGVLRENGLTIQEERYAVGRDGARLFGVIQVGPSETNVLHNLRREGQSFAIGLRSGNAGDMSIKVAAGLRVTVCDNMVLAGTFLAMKKKHTTGLVLDAELREAVTRYQEQQVQVIARTDRARDLVLTDDEARLAIFGAFERKLLSSRYFPEVVANYFTPDAAWTDCTPRSRWGLVGAFTRAIRPMPAETKLRTTTSLAYLLSDGRN